MKDCDIKMDIKWPGGPNLHYSAVSLIDQRYWRTFLNSKNLKKIRERARIKPQIPVVFLYF